MNTENTEIKSDTEQARIVLGQELIEREKRCATEIQALLAKEGFKLNISQTIVLEPTR